jgi:hypothetical protein
MNNSTDLKAIANALERSILVIDLGTGVDVLERVTAQVITPSLEDQHIYNAKIGKSGWLGRWDDNSKRDTDIVLVFREDHFNAVSLPVLERIPVSEGRGTTQERRHLLGDDGALQLSD